METANQSALTMNTDWITFMPNEHSDFSESFKKRMAESLYPQLYGMLDNKISENEFEFHLWIDETDLKMSVKDNYVFILARLSTVFAKSYDLTVAWTSPDFENPLDIHKADLSDKNVKFAWCADFPKDEIIERLQPTKVITKKESGFKFDAVYYLYTFPDISIYFDFNGIPSDESLKALDKEVKNYRDTYKTIFAHDLVKYRNDYIISINHNTIDYTNDTEQDFQKVIDNLNNLLAAINNNPDIIDLKRIRLR